MREHCLDSMGQRLFLLLIVIIAVAIIAVAIIINQAGARGGTLPQDVLHDEIDVG